jgi:hypothetical protein
MEKFTFNKNNDIIEINRNLDNKKIYSFKIEDTEDDFMKNVWYCETSEGDFILCNDVTNGYTFPPLVMIDVNNDSIIEMLPNMKGGVKKLVWSKKCDYFFVFGYSCGMINTYQAFNFKGEEIDTSDIYGDCFSYNHKDGIRSVNDDIIFSIVIPEEYFNNDLYSHYDIDFNKNALHKNEHNYLLDVYKHSDNITSNNVESNNITLNNIILDSSDEIEKVKKFIKYCSRRKYIESVFESFTKNNQNIFKKFLSEEYDFVKVDKNNLYHDNINKFFELNTNQIKDMSCNGLYSGSDYFNHYCNFMKYEFDTDTFGDFLVRNTLGFEYHTNKCIPKQLLPNGIGLVFKITTVNDVVYQYAIKMSLVELDNDAEKVTYAKEKSKIEVDVTIYQN